MIIVCENFSFKFNTNYSEELFSKMFSMKYDSILNYASSLLIDGKAYKNI